jgi:hypothetical protein
LGQAIERRDLLGAVDGIALHLSLPIISSRGATSSESGKLLTG